MQRKMFVVMRLGSPGVLSYLNAGFEPPCGVKGFLSARLLLLAAAAAAGAAAACQNVLLTLGP